MDIVLKAKEMPTDGTLRCSCGGNVMPSWAGCPVIAYRGEPGMPLCRNCAAEQAPLLVALADLACAAAITRPDSDPAPVIDAVMTFRASAMDAAQAATVAFALESGIRKLPES